jgi:hypothetical protein
MCDEWPIRDFNAWRLAGDCASWWPTALGPLFSYALMALGCALAVRGVIYRWLGVAVIFAANPFARIFTAAMGGGDEMVVAQRLANFPERTPVLRLLVLLFVLAICGSAVVIGWRAMQGVARRGALFVLILLWPMILTGVALFVIGNRLLKAGVLAAQSIGGAPLLVTVVSGVAALLAVLTHKWLLGTRSLA